MRRPSRVCDPPSISSVDGGAPPVTGSLALTVLAALGTALVLGAVAHRLRMPPMIGYIAAGLIVGPFTPGYVANHEEVESLADIGVALLMFSIGLRFRVDELASVGRVVLIGAPAQVAISLGLGTLTALLLGESLVAGLFLGAVVSVCSSVVLVKVAGDGVLETTRHGRLALGWSLIQDVLTIVLVVALSAVATESTDALRDAAVRTAVALAFVGAVLGLGRRVLPAALGRVALLGSRELFVVAVAVLAIGTAAAAGWLGVSVALGAFLAGLALAESDLAISVLAEVVPLRELFSTIFFVSVGLLLQPAAVADGWPVVLALLALIVIGKGLIVAGILRLGGDRPSVVARTAGLLAQGGEFSFVLATVGLQAGALGAAAFSQAMGAVVLSIVVAAPVASLGGRIGDWLERRSPGTAAHAQVSAGMRRHVIVIGYGYVGRMVARILDARGYPWIAIEVDYPAVREAAARGVRLIYGNGGTPSVLDAAGVAEATTLVVAVPDALATRQAVQYARSRNGRIEVVARAHSSDDEAHLRRIGASRVITAERELGHELVRHVLRRYGVSDREIDAILRRG
jgi:CPA2 family monovalent cation:H+ antiporter-2